MILLILFLLVHISNIIIFFSQLSNHSTASSGFMISLGDGSVNLSNTWGRQLSETSSGNVCL